MKPALLLVCALVLAGCTTPLATGERLYREGDRLGALETWRSVPANASEYDESQERIAVVEEEFNRLVIRYKQRARYFEAKERLAESILDYRLALKLQPDDAETMAHVQELARVVASRKALRRAQFRSASEAGDLGAAREQLEQLRILDPFDPDIQTDERQLVDALRLAVTRELTAGRRQFMAGNHDSARRHFRSVLELDPDNESAQGYISYIATIRRERESATGRSATFASQEGFASDAEIRAEGFYQNALAAQRRGKFYSAIRHDLRALQAFRDHAEARGHLRAMRRRLSGGVDSLIEAGRNAYREEDLQTALELWTRALLIDPRNERARAYVDRARRQLQNLERLRSEPDVVSPAG
ncbi:MAG: tetratricopeptide repeat protein [Myxococcota bacterium]